MKPKVRRRLLRRYHAIPMHFRSQGSDQRHQAVIRDCSRNGLQFESDCFLTPGTEIVIDANAYLDTLAREHPADAYGARVVWCEEVLVDGRTAFATGVCFGAWHAQ
jgi:hypothetical protein